MNTHEDYNDGTHLMASKLLKIKKEWVFLGSWNIPIWNSGIKSVIIILGFRP